MGVRRVNKIDILGPYALCADFYTRGSAVLLLLLRISAISGKDITGEIWANKPFCYVCHGRPEWDCGSTDVHREEHNKKDCRTDEALSQAKPEDIMCKTWSFQSLRSKYNICVQQAIVVGIWQDVSLYILVLYVYVKIKRGLSLEIPG